MSRRCSDVVTTLLRRCVSAGQGSKAYSGGQWRLMRTLIWVFARRTYYLVENAVSGLIVKLIYTPQNNLRATSFISPLIVAKMQPSSITIISWTKLEVSALFQSAQYVRNMFSYKSVNGTNNARPDDSKKNGNFQTTIFFNPKMKFVHNTGKKNLCLMKTILCHTQNHANSTFIQVKGTQIRPEKETNPLRG